MDNKVQPEAILIAENGCRLSQSPNLFGDRVVIVCDEEGKLRNTELNRSLWDEHGKIHDILAGTFLVVGVS